MGSNLGYRVAQFILGALRSVITGFVVLGMAISMGALADNTAVSKADPGPVMSQQASLAD